MGDCLHLGLDGLRLLVAAHKGRLQGQGLGQVRVLERLPVERVEVGRAGDLEGQLLQTGIAQFGIAAVGVAIGKDLFEELVAILLDARSGLRSVDLVREGELEVLLEVPLQPRLLEVVEGRGKGKGMFVAADDDHGRARGSSRAAAFANADERHGSLLGGEKW